MQTTTEAQDTLYGDVAITGTAGGLLQGSRLKAGQLRPEIAAHHSHTVADRTARLLFGEKESVSAVLCVLRALCV